MTPPGRETSDSYPRGVPPGFVRESPGFYHGPDETLFIHAAELCRAQGIPPTEANQRKLGKWAMEIAAERGIPAEEREV